MHPIVAYFQESGGFSPASSGLLCFDPVSTRLLTTRRNEKDGIQSVVRSGEDDFKVSAKSQD